MPFIISMLVLQTRLSPSTEWTGDGVSLGNAAPTVGERVGEAVSVFTAGTGAEEVTAGVTLIFEVGGGMISGVAVKMGGVLDGGGV